MSADLPSQTLLEELDARQDEVLAELDALNRRLEQVLKEFTIARPANDDSLPAAA
jgi:hypothetical protein